MDIEKIRIELKKSNIELIYKITGVHPHTLRKIRDSEVDTKVSIYEKTLKKLETYFNEHS